MRAAALLGAIVVALVLLPGPAAGGRQKPYVLTALADTGTVYWRYDFVHYRTPRWSLGVRLFNTATTDVIYRDGNLRLRRTLQPRQFGGSRSALAGGNASRSFRQPSPAPSERRWS